MAARKRDKRRRATFQDYEKWCGGRGMVSVPASTVAVGSYLVASVERLKGSSRSLDQRLSQLRVHVKRRWGVQMWLDDEGEVEVKEVTRVLKFFDLSEVKRARPLTQKLLDKLLKLRDDSSAVSMMLRTVYSVGHDALMRGGELTSGLMRGDVEQHWDKKGFRLRLDRTKTVREGGPARAQIRERGNGDKESGAYHLRKWLGKTNPSDIADQALFPQLVFEGGRPVGFNRKAPLTKEALVKALRYDLDSLGIIMSKEYTGHSFRAGGATDLFASGMITLEQIMKVGRWQSAAAALVYFRDELISADIAARAFASSCETQTR